MGSNPINNLERLHSMSQSNTRHATIPNDFVRIFTGSNFYHEGGQLSTGSNFYHEGGQLNTGSNSYLYKIHQ